MTPVLTAEAMREADRLTIESFGLPGFTLMETAGRAAADAIEQHFGPMRARSVTIVCGKGNNGGDGFVVARILHARGAKVVVVALAGPEAMTEDAARNYRLLETLEREDGRRIRLLPYANLRQLAALAMPDVFVDALLGTGLTSALREPIDGIVGWLNEQPRPTVALDVPTGLHSDTGIVLGTAVEAALTVTMAAPKAGLLLGKGPDHTGALEVAEIGIPRFLLDRVAERPGCAALPSDDDVRALMPRRAHDAHKYSAGLALVVGGAAGMTGAPTMAALAAARSGAGFVTCACAASLQSTLAAKLTAVTTLALPEAGDEGIDPDGALTALDGKLDKARSLLVGPGLGGHPATRRFVHRLVMHTDVPLVLDADGLNAVAGDIDDLADRRGGNWVLTPHAGEFKRLAGDVDLSDRLGVARAHAQRWNCVLVLKGMPSVIGTPDGRVFIGATGNPALATAGTGDVLGGLIAGFLAQGLPLAEAALVGLHVGGAAADRYVTSRYPTTLIATDLLDEVPLVLHERFA